MRAAVASISSILLVVALPLLGPSGFVAGAGASSPPTTYYVALGDSLSTGGGATPGNSYVDDIYAHEESLVPGLQLENLGCAGNSTTKMIHGGNCTNYTTGNQLGDAEAFLGSHVGAVKFVTIDIGEDDVNGCAPSGVINNTCVQTGLQAAVTNMQTILGGLRAAGGNVPMVGMVYYDPWLAFYLKGPSGQQAAIASLGLLHQLNSELRVPTRSIKPVSLPCKRTLTPGTWRSPARSTARLCPRTWQTSATGPTCATRRAPTTTPTIPGTQCWPPPSRPD